MEGKGHYHLEVVPYVEQLSEEMVQYLLDGVPRARMMLLSVLDEAEFSPHYSRLYRAFRLIQLTGLDVDFRMPSTELLQLLIARKMFTEAREWAHSCGLVGDTIVFEEVTGMIVEFRQGVWWNVLAERLQLWHKCYDAFLRENYPPVGAALFFLDITSKLEPDLFAREQLMLICIAYELLTASGASASHTSRQPQAPTKDQVSRIKLSLLLILTGTNEALASDLEFSPLDLSYAKLRTLAHRVPESVTALPLYQGAETTGSSSSPIWGVGATAPGVGVLSAAPTAPTTELLPFLDTAISSLVNCDELGWARQLAQGFSFESNDLRLAVALETVASGHYKEAVQDLMTGISPIETPPAGLLAAEEGNAVPLMEALGGHCSQRIALFCRRRTVFFSVSRMIVMPYRQVAQVDPGELIARLLGRRPLEANLGLVRSLLAVYPRTLNKEALAEVLASTFLRSMHDKSDIQWPEEKLDEFVSLLSPGQDKLGEAALRRIPSFKSASQAATTELRLLPTGEELPLEIEVEVLVLAYNAFVQAGRESSVAALLSFLQGRAKHYVEHGSFHLLVRLLVAIPEYHAMEYLFGYLIRYNQLDQLLSHGQESRAQAGSGSGPRRALAVALVRYLQANFGRNLELLVQVHLCFGMEAELAALLKHKAGLVTLNLGRKWEKICSEEGEDQLITCLSLYLQCAKLFLRSKRYQQHLRANELAALVCLQLKAVQIHLAASLQEQQNAAAAAAKAAALEASKKAHEPSPPWSPAVEELPALRPEGTEAEEETEAELKPTVLTPSLQRPEEAALEEAAPEVGSGDPPINGQLDKVKGAPVLGPAGDAFVIINLAQQEVEVFVEYHQDFVTAFQVLTAYKQTYGDVLSEVWPRALYRQVVLLGNRQYLLLYLSHLRLTQEQLDIVVKLFLNESDKFPAHTRRMKQLLREGVSNLLVRLQMARQLGADFTDITMETASLVYMS